jgi:parallel beta-helix repeat protein
VRFSDCPLSHNIFDNNYSALGGGFGILHVPICRHAVSNNLFMQNGALYFGAAISNGNSSPLYVNNTIADNHCDGGGGGFYCKDSVVPVLVNNIIYGNTQFGGESNQVYLWDLLSQPNFYYNNIEGGSQAFYGTGGSAFSGDYENNLDMDPMFYPNTFSIPAESPCINTGNPDTAGLHVPMLDIYNNMRLVGSAIDMGACENQFPLDLPEVKMTRIGMMEVFPNPAIDRMLILVNLGEPSLISISVSNALGNSIGEVYQGWAQDGESTYYWNVKNAALASGICFVRLETEKGILLQKALVVQK